MEPDEQGFIAAARAHRDQSHAEGMNRLRRISNDQWMLFTGKVVESGKLVLEGVGGGEMPPAGVALFMRACAMELLEQAEQIEAEYGT